MSCCVAVNWLDHSRTFREQGVDENETLLLRRKFFYSDQNVDSRDPVQLNLLYVQVQYLLLRHWGWWDCRKLLVVSCGEQEGGAGFCHVYGVVSSRRCSWVPTCLVVVQVDILDEQLTIRSRVSLWLPRLCPGSQHCIPLCRALRDTFISLNWLTISSALKVS